MLAKRGHFARHCVGDTAAAADDDQACQFGHIFDIDMVAPLFALARTQSGTAPPSSAPPRPPAPPLPPERWEPDPSRRPERPAVDTTGFAATYFACMLALFLAVCATVPVGAALVSAFGWPGGIGAVALGGLAIVTLLQR